MAKEVVTGIHINAPPEKVWQVLVANEQWYAWNPFIIKSEGSFVVGQKVVNTMAMEGRKPMVFRPTVLKADSQVELRWLGRVLVPGLFDGEHYFQLRPQDGGTHLVHGEIFRGLLIGLLSMDDVRRNFEAMNAALKARVEG